MNTIKYIFSVTLLVTGYNAYGMQQQSAYHIASDEIQFRSQDLRNDPKLRREYQNHFFEWLNSDSTRKQFKALPQNDQNLPNIIMTIIDKKDQEITNTLNLPRQSAFTILSQTAAPVEVHSAKIARTPSIGQHTSPIKPANKATQKINIPSRRKSVQKQLFPTDNTDFGIEW